MAGKRAFYSPLRYPGGKTKLAPFVKALFFENKLVGKKYIEPYAGGAGIALTLLFEKYVSKITINDYDPSIHAFWWSIKFHNSHFIEKVRATAVNMTTWEKQKEIQEIQQGNKENPDLFELGFSTFFLNRTNVSGIIKGGVIGGKDQKGPYKLDVRFNKEKLIENIRRIGKYKHRITVEQKNAIEIFDQDLDNTFLYIDPPYVRKAKDVYMNYYEEKDHTNIAEKILHNESDFRWLLSYDQSNLIKDLYKSHRKRKITWEPGYGASNKVGKEDLFMHKSLKYKESQKLLVKKQRI